MKSEKSLSFNGAEIIFVISNNEYFIALKPICEALKVDYIRSFKNAKNDPILGSVLSEQTIQVSKNGKKQGRKMTCIPEEFIYGWLFSLRSESLELIEYKKTCYRLLYKHFHGTITNRKDILIERKSVDLRIAKLKNVLKETNPVEKEILQLKTEKLKLTKELERLDNKLITPELFPEN